MVGFSATASSLQEASNSFPTFTSPANVKYDLVVVKKKRRRTKKENYEKKKKKTMKRRNKRKTKRRRRRREEVEKLNKLDAKEEVLN